MLAVRARVRWPNEDQRISERIPDAAAPRIPRSEEKLTLLNDRGSATSV